VGFPIRRNLLVLGPTVVFSNRNLTAVRAAFTINLVTLREIFHVSCGEMDFRVASCSAPPRKGMKSPKHLELPLSNNQPLKLGQQFSQQKDFIV